MSEVADSGCSRRKSEHSYCYRACGLELHSEFPLVGCPTAVDDFDPLSVVRIRRGRVPARLDGSRLEGAAFQAKPGEFLLRLEGFAAYYVRQGREILVEATSGADPRDVQLFLLGSVLGAVLHQRGCFALHASAVETPEGAFVFCGPSGIGKSTLAAALHARGYPLVTDDICSVQVGEESTRLFPGFPWLKLWRDALGKLGHDCHKLAKVRPSLDKYRLETPPFTSAAQFRVQRVYVLTTSDTEVVQLRRPGPSRRFQLLAGHTYRPHFLPGFGRAGEHFQNAMGMLRTVDLRLVERPRTGFSLDEVITAILGELD